MYSAPFKKSKTTDFFYELNKYVYLFGLPDYWIEDLRLPIMFMRLYDRVKIVANFCVYIMILSEYGAYITQKGLSVKQESDLLMFSVSHTLIWSFRTILAHRKLKIKHIMYTLGVVLKEVFNDVKIEERMIKRSRIFSWGLNFSCFLTVTLYTIDASARVMQKGETFTTIITVWPDVNETSKLADVTRIVFYIFWWIFMTRIFAVYMLVITVTVCLAHQYENLQRYFYSINDIFNSNNIEQAEKERMYEYALKLGIKMHAVTLRCTNQTQTVFNYVFSGQIFFNISILIVLMTQMVDSERTAVTTVVILLTASTVLTSTGVFMCNAGEVTAEAAKITTAMYFSGWHNCTRESSKRIRNLVAISMAQAQVCSITFLIANVMRYWFEWLKMQESILECYQKLAYRLNSFLLGLDGDRHNENSNNYIIPLPKQPVVLRGFGIVELSYQSYVSIVKSSYSVFSVLY